MDQPAPGTERVKDFGKRPVNDVLTDQAARQRGDRVLLSAVSVCGGATISGYEGGTRTGVTYHDKVGLKFAQELMEIDVLSCIAIGGAVFVSTDVDDLVMLLALFADPAFDRRLIVIGQFIGMAILVLASVLIAALAVRVSREGAALLGVVPVAFGLRGIWKLWRSRRCRGSTESAASFALGGGPRTASQLIAVTVLTVSNGGDNLVTYVPLFAAAPQRIPLYAAVFAALTTVWCALAYLCVNNRIVRAQAHRFGHTVLPFAMVLLGLWTLSGVKGHVP